MRSLGFFLFFVFFFGLRFEVAMLRECECNELYAWALDSAVCEFSMGKWW